MRIIAGALGGRNFSSPHSRRTHPMSDRVRGALFNTLGDIRGLTVLDTFAGSGALGFEAVSRGVAKVILIENDKPAQQAIVTSIERLGVEDKVWLVQSSCSSWSDSNKDFTFDLVLLDPPYDDIRWLLLQKLTRHVKPGGILVLSWPGRQELPVFDELELVDAKQYGDAQLIFYRKA